MYSGFTAEVKQKTKVQLYGEPIWTNLYQVIVKYRDTISNGALRDHGLPTVGDQYIDQSMYNQPQHVCITINAMIEYYTRGSTITFKDNRDARTVYEIVNRYLMAWEEEIDGAVVDSKTPTNDLISLDQFAKTLYPQVLMFGEPPKKVSSLFMDQLLGSSQFNRGSMAQAIRDRSAVPVPVKPGAPVAPPEGHRSLTSFFANALSNGREAWK